MRLNKAEKTEIEQIFSRYKEDESLDTFNIIHLYPTERTGIRNDGYVDSRFFELVGYNSERELTKKLGLHDGISFYRLQTQVDIVRIFLDGSTLIKFLKPIKVDDYQAVTIFDS